MRRPSERPDYNHMIRGPDEFALEKLSDIVDVFIGRWAYFIKIGITNNPERRWEEHKDDPRWEGMAVVYETDDRDEIRWLEQELVDRYRHTENVIRGGGGPEGSGNQYLYFLVTKRYNLTFPTRPRKPYF